jgi:hypothetical protein
MTATKIMRNPSAILKRLEKIESAIQGIANPRTVIRLIGDEQAPEDSDSILIIRRQLTEPKPIASDNKSAALEDNTSENQ